jgi:hypothetical protein
MVKEFDAGSAPIFLKDCQMSSKTTMDRYGEFYKKGNH